MPTGLWGANDLTFTKFRGLVEDCDPTEIGEDRASAALNVDFQDECLSKRLGRSYRSRPATPGSLGVTGLHAYYPQDGSPRVLLWSDTGGIRIDYPGGLALLGVTTGRMPVDFVGYQDRVYIGSASTDLQVWNFSSDVQYVRAPATPAFPTPPAAAVVRAHDMQDATDWASSNAALTASNQPFSPDTLMLMQATSSAAVLQRIESLWSTGATLDLSLHDTLEFDANSGFAGLQFQIGIKDNTGTIRWLGSPLTVETANLRTTYSVSLADIAPADRNASTGVAISFHAPLGGAGYPQSILFYPIYLVVPFEADTYRYYATYYASGAAAMGLPAESAPSPAGEVTLAPEHHAASIDLSVPYSIDPAVTQVRIYRKRVDAPYARPRLVVELPNDGVLGTYSDRRTDAALLLEDAAEWATEFLIDPPRGATTATVRNRLLVGGGGVPWRIYVSEYQKPYSFASSQSPSDPFAAGYIDLGEKDPIVRIVDVDGNAVVFCQRSIWTVEGSGWDDFVVRKRASVGIDARWGLAVYGRLVLFLAADGVRCLSLTFGATESFSAFVVSEPIASHLRAIGATTRSLAACGIDERERLHLSYASSGSTVNDSALVLDLRQPGALTNKQDPTRPGWTLYSGWGFSVFETLKRGGGDNGQLVGGDVAEDALWSLQRDTADLALEADNGAPIPWSWTGPCVDVGRGKKAPLVYLAAEVDPAVRKAVTLGAVLDRGRQTVEANLSLGKQAIGIIPLIQRVAGEARYFQAQVSGSHLVPMRVRSAGMGVYVARAR